MLELVWEELQRVLVSEQAQELAGVPGVLLVHLVVLREPRAQAAAALPDHLQAAVSAPRAHPPKEPKPVSPGCGAAFSDQRRTTLGDRHTVRIVRVDGTLSPLRLRCRPIRQGGRSIPCKPSTSMPATIEVRQIV